MELLNDLARDDPVSRLLRAVRVRASVWCRSELRAPWGFGVAAHGSPAFHVVTEGRCWLEVEGEPEPRELAAGDLVVLPAGPRHWMRDDPATPATELEAILAATPPDASGRLRHGGAGPATRLLCGGFSLEGGDAHPLLRALPGTLHVPGAGGQPVPWLDATLALLREETASDAPGAEEVVNRLADALLTQVLRGALEQTDASLAQIAARSGYGNEYSFGRAFKRAFGIAPGGYRALSSSSNAASSSSPSSSASGSVSASA